MGIAGPLATDEPVEIEKQAVEFRDFGKKLHLITEESMEYIQSE